MFFIYASTIFRWELERQMCETEDFTVNVNLFILFFFALLHIFVYNFTEKHMPHMFKVLLLLLKTGKLTKKKSRRYTKLNERMNRRDERWKREKKKETKSIWLDLQTVSGCQVKCEWDANGEWQPDSVWSFG